MCFKKMNKLDLKQALKDIFNKLILTKEDREELADLLSNTVQEETIGDLQYLETIDKSSVVNAINELAHKGNMINVTYEQLVYYCERGMLIPGCDYRITNYVCTSTKENTRALVNRFDIVVTADTKYTLNENARAIHHENDTYFANSNLAAWKLKYCVNNDSTRFAWACESSYIILTTLAGVPLVCSKLEDIPGMSQDGTIESDSALKTVIAFTEGCSSSQASSIYDELGEDSFDAINYFYERYNAACLEVLGRGSKAEYLEYGKGTIYYLKDEWGNEAPYDFKNIQFSVPFVNGQYNEDGDDAFVFTFNAYNEDAEVCEDATLLNNCQLDDAGCVCKNNVIKEYNFDYLGYNYSLIRLNRNVLLNVYSIHDESYFECYSNTFKEQSHDNIFNNYSRINTIGIGAFNNVLSGARSHGINIEYGATNTTIGAGCSNVKIGQFCNNNLILNNNHNIEIDKNSNSNTIKANCSCITFIHTSNKTDFNESDVLYINGTKIN